MKKIIILRQFFFILAILFTINCNSQIEYTNISPDSTVSHPDTIEGSNYYNIDLNSDGEIDFKIGAEYYKNTEYTNSNLNNYLVKIVSDTLNMVNAIPYFDGDIISGSDNFTNANWIYGIIAGFGEIGPWPGVINDNEQYAYVGLKFFNGGNTYYGWVSLKVNGYSFTINGYAWNRYQGQPIIAGQTE